MELANLYRIAHRHGIPVLLFSMPKCESMSLQTEDGCVIGMDKSVCDCRSIEATHLAHELGHCLTGSFYNARCSHDLRQRHENRANKWAVECMIPSWELDKAVAEGHTTLWELADHFGVTEDFMRKAVCYHVHGNLAAELYF